MSSGICTSGESTVILPMTVLRRLEAFLSREVLPHVKEAWYVPDGEASAAVCGRFRRDFQPQRMDGYRVRPRHTFGFLLRCNTARTMAISSSTRK